MIKVDNKNFDKIKDAYVASVIENMDMKSLIQFATECVYNNLNSYTIMDLEEEVNQFYDDITELDLNK